MIRFVAVLIASLSLCSSASAQDTPTPVDPTSLAPLQVDVTCPVSGTSHRSVANAVRYRGRVYYLADGACRQAFLAEPGPIAAGVAPNGLFHPTDASRPRSDTVWILGLLVVLALLFVALASNRLRKRPATRAPAACTACGAALHPTATKCAACGVGRAADAESDVVRLGRRTS